MLKHELLPSVHHTVSEGNPMSTYEDKAPHQAISEQQVVSALEEHMQHMNLSQNGAQNLAFIL